MLDFGAPKGEGRADKGKFRKLAERVEQVLNQEVLFKEPKQLDPRAVLVAPLNRDGAPPNVMHIHHGILKSIVLQGFDQTRPQVGIRVEFKSEKGKIKLLEHNRRFTEGVSLMPPHRREQGRPRFSRGASPEPRPAAHPGGRALARRGPREPPPGQ